MNRQWEPIFRSSKIPEYYYPEAALLCERILNGEYSKEKENLCMMTLRVMSKIDLSKVEFTNNKYFCEKYHVKVSFDPYNDMSRYGIDGNTQIQVSICNEIVKMYKENIEKNGGIIVYSITEHFCEVVDPSSYYKQFYAGGRMINCKSARFAKISKLQQRIYGNKLSKINDK